MCAAHSNHIMVTLMTKSNNTKPAKNRMSRQKKIAWLWGYIFIAPVILGTLTFSAGPVLYSFYMSLTDWDGLSPGTPPFVGFGNFISLFRDSYIFKEFTNTLIYAVGVVPLTIMIAIILANFLNSRVPARSFFRVVYFLPIVTMPIAVAMVWRWLFNSEMGLVNFLFRPFGLNPQWLGDAKWIMPALIIVSVWSGVGYATVILIAGLQSIAPMYYEVAEIDGANFLTKFFRITLPLLSPTIFFLLITEFIGAFKAFDIVFMFSGASNTSRGPVTDAIRTMVYGIYERGFTFRTMGYAAAQAVLLFGFILIFTGLQFLLQSKTVFYD